MLYVNDQQVDLKGNSVYAQEFKKAKKEIDELGYPVRLRIKPTWITGSMTQDGQWVPNIPVQGINYTTTEYREDEGSVEWRYSPTPAKMVNGELRFTENRTRFFENNRRTEMIGEDKKDFLFFLLYKSPYNGSVFEVIDERSEAKKRVQEKRRQARLSEALYGINSPLQSDNEKLKMIAQSWNVEVGERTTPEMMLDRLERSVLAGEEGKKKGKGMRGIDELLEDLKFGDNVKIRATIQEAVNSGVIGFNDNTNSYGWFFLDSSGQPKQKIVGIAPKSEDIKEQKLADYLQRYTATLDSIRDMLNEKPEGDDFDPNKIDEYSFKELKEQGKKININVVGVKDEKVRQKFKEYYNVK